MFHLFILPCGMAGTAGRYAFKSMPPSVGKGATVRTVQTKQKGLKPKDLKQPVRDTSIHNYEKVVPKRAQKVQKGGQKGILKSPVRRNSHTAKSPLAAWSPKNAKSPKNTKSPMNKSLKSPKSTKKLTGGSRPSVGSSVGSVPTKESRPSVASSVPESTRTPRRSSDFYKSLHAPLHLRRLSNPKSVSPGSEPAVAPGAGANKCRTFLIAVAVIFVIAAILASIGAMIYFIVFKNDDEAPSKPDNRTADTETLSTEQQQSSESTTLGISTEASTQVTTVTIPSTIATTAAPICNGTSLCCNWKVDQCDSTISNNCSIPCDSWVSSAVGCGAANVQCRNCEKWTLQLDPIGAVANITCAQCSLQPCCEWESAASNVTQPVQQFKCKQPCTELRKCETYELTNMTLLTCSSHCST